MPYRIEHVETQTWHRVIEDLESEGFEEVYRYDGQARPVGDELSEGDSGVHVELWVAETRHGHPWVVLGTAEGEEEFWRAVEGDEDLSSLGAGRPARRERAFFLAEGAPPKS